VWSSALVPEPVRGRARRYFWRAAAAGAALALLACGHSSPPQSQAKPALELVQSEGFTFVFRHLTEGQFIAYGTSTAAVHEPTRVIDVRPLEESGAVKFAGANVAYYACQPNCRARPGYWGVRTLFGGLCGPIMPRSRAVYPATGAELLPGDAPIFILVGRMTGDGEASLRGLRIIYEVDGHRREVHSRVNSVVVDNAEPARAGQCGDPATEAWFGGSRATRLIRRL
jgi:hypothetical protein